MAPSLYSYGITPVFSKLAITLPDLALPAGDLLWLASPGPAPLESVMLKTYEEVAASSLADHTDRPTSLEK